MEAMRLLSVVLQCAEPVLLIVDVDLHILPYMTQTGISHRTSYRTSLRQPTRDDDAWKPGSVFPISALDPFWAEKLRSKFLRLKRD